MKVLFWCCVTLTVFSVVLSAPADGVVENVDDADYRLNTDIEPTEYTIDLTPYFDNETGNEPFTFDGTVVITLKATKSNVTTITLHKDELNITETILSTRAKIQPSYPWNVLKIAIKNTTYNDTTKKYSLELDEALDQNQLYELTFKYKGKLRTDMHGFYRSSYKEGNETK